MDLRGRGEQGVTLLRTQGKKKPWRELSRERRGREINWVHDQRRECRTEKVKKVVKKSGRKKYSRCGILAKEKSKKMVTGKEKANTCAKHPVQRDSGKKEKGKLWADFVREEKRGPGET